MYLFFGGCLVSRIIAFLVGVKVIVKRRDKSHYYHKLEKVLCFFMYCKLLRAGLDFTYNDCIKWLLFYTTAENVLLVLVQQFYSCQMVILVSICYFLFV